MRAIFQKFFPLIALCAGIGIIGAVSVFAAHAPNWPVFVTVNGNHTGARAEAPGRSVIVRWQNLDFLDSFSGNQSSCSLEAYEAASCDQYLDPGRVCPIDGITGTRTRGFAPINVVPPPLAKEGSKTFLTTVPLIFHLVCPTQNNDLDTYQRAYASFNIRNSYIVPEWIGFGITHNNIKTTAGEVSITRELWSLGTNAPAPTEIFTYIDGGRDSGGTLFARNTVTVPQCEHFRTATASRPPQCPGITQTVTIPLSALAVGTHTIRSEIFLSPSRNYEQARQSGLDDSGRVIIFDETSGIGAPPAPMGRIVGRVREVKTLHEPIAASTYVGPNANCPARTDGRSKVVPVTIAAQTQQLAWNCDRPISDPEQYQFYGTELLPSGSIARTVIFTAPKEYQCIGWVKTVNGIATNSAFDDPNVGFNRPDGNAQRCTVDGVTPGTVTTRLTDLSVPPVPEEGTHLWFEIQPVPSSPPVPASIPAQETLQLRVDPSVIDSGGTSILSWAATGASQLFLSYGCRFGVVIKAGNDIECDRQYRIDNISGLGFSGSLPVVGLNNTLTEQGVVFHLRAEWTSGSAPRIENARLAIRPNGPPVVESCTFIPVSGYAPLTTQFRVFARDPEGGALHYRWSFGDGTSILLQDIANPIHRYQAPGRYRIVVTVVDDQESQTANACGNAVAFGDTFVLDPSSASVQKGDSTTFFARYDADGPDGPRAERAVMPTAVTVSDDRIAAIERIDRGTITMRGIKEGEVTITAFYQGQGACQYCSGEATAILNVTAKPNAPPEVLNCVLYDIAATETEVTKEFAATVRDPDATAVRCNFNFGDGINIPQPDPVSGGTQVCRIQHTYLRDNTLQQYGVTVRAVDNNNAQSNGFSCGTVRVPPLGEPIQPSPEISPPGGPPGGGTSATPPSGGGTPSIPGIPLVPGVPGPGGGPPGGGTGQNPSLRISPDPAFVRASSTIQFRVFIDPDGSGPAQERELTKPEFDSLGWTSGNIAIANLTATNGLFHGVSAGQTDITAIFGGIQDTATLNVLSNGGVAGEAGGGGEIGGRAQTPSNLDFSLDNFCRLTNPAIEFRWGVTQPQTSYDFQLSYDDQFTASAIRQRMISGDLRLSLTLLKGLLELRRPYYWRVRSQVGSGQVVPQLAEPFMLAGSISALGTYRGKAIIGTEENSEVKLYMHDPNQIGEAPSEIGVLPAEGGPIHKIVEFNGNAILVRDTAAYMYNGTTISSAPIFTLPADDFTGADQSTLRFGDAAAYGGNMYVAVNGMTDDKYAAKVYRYDGSSLTKSSELPDVWPTERLCPNGGCGVSLHSGKSGAQIAALEVFNGNLFMGTWWPGDWKLLFNGKEVTKPPVAANFAPTRFAQYGVTIIYQTSNGNNWSVAANWNDDTNFPLNHHKITVMGAAGNTLWAGGEDRGLTVRDDGFGGNSIESRSTEAAIYSSTNGQNWTRYETNYGNNTKPTVSIEGYGDNAYVGISGNNNLYQWPENKFFGSSPAKYFSAVGDALYAFGGNQFMVYRTNSDTSAWAVGPAVPARGCGIRDTIFEFFKEF